MTVIKVHCLACGNTLNPRVTEKRLKKIKKAIDVKEHHQILLRAYTCDNICFLGASKDYEERLSAKKKEAEEHDRLLGL